MTLEKWKTLDEAEQAESIRHGHLVAERPFDKYQVRLYWLGGLYVEVYYDLVSNTIAKFEPMKTTDPNIALALYRAGAN